MMFVRKVALLLAVLLACVSRAQAQSLIPFDQAVSTTQIFVPTIQVTKTEYVLDPVTLTTVVRVFGPTSKLDVGWTMDLDAITGTPINLSAAPLTDFERATLATLVSVLLVGVCLGFLPNNFFPARIFMGDTGSLAIGGMLGAVAICCKQELLLVIVGGVFVIEAMSVILQVASFKTTGRRIFKMSPIHHHFELSGWKENTVIVRFWILSVFFALLGLATLKLR